MNERYTSLEQSVDELQKLIYDYDEVDIKGNYHIKVCFDTNDIILTNKKLNDIKIVISTKIGNNFEKIKNISVRNKNNNIFFNYTDDNDTVLDDIEYLTEIINKYISKYKEFIEYCISKIHEDFLDFDYSLNLNDLSLVIKNKQNFVHVELCFIDNNDANDITPIVNITNSSLRNEEIYYLDSINYSDVWDTIEFYL